MYSMSSYKGLFVPPPKTNIGQRKSEELINALVHAVGLGLAIAGLAVIMVQSMSCPDVWCITGTLLYGSTLILTYLSSTLYHGTQDPELKHKFRILDHITIYLAIAGGYSPFLLSYMRDPTGWIMFFALWSIAIFGICFKLCLFGRFERISVASYVTMGWVGLVCVDRFMATIPDAGLLWLFIGGFFYTIGVYFYANDHKPWYHTIWHLLVVIGSICHYIAILFYVVIPNSQLH